jgi:hypothetical protein
VATPSRTVASAGIAPSCARASPAAGAAITTSGTRIPTRTRPAAAEAAHATKTACRAGGPAQCPQGRRYDIVIADAARAEMHEVYEKIDHAALALPTRAGAARPSDACRAASCAPRRCISARLGCSHSRG